MKTFTVILLFAVILGCYIEVDAGSFNASAYWNPGIQFGRRRSVHQKHPARNNEDDDDANSAWSHPSHSPTSVTPTSSNEHIHNETGSNDNKPPHGHHHRSHHRASRH